MIACLRSTRFMYPDRSRSIFLELRRLHDIKAAKNNKAFVVMKRMSMPNLITQKAFGTLREARTYWREQASILADEGLVSTDFRIAGFHEED